MTVWNTATPAGTDLISAGDDNIREMKLALEAALSTEAVFPGGSPLTAPVFKWTGKRGNTAGRPGTPSTGEIYFNTELFQMEYYSGAVWTAYDLLPALGVSTAKIAALAVTDAKINDVAFSKVTGTVTPSDNTVTTAKIVDANVTDGKIVTVAASKITGTLPVANGGTGITTKSCTVGTYTGDGSSNRDIPHGLGVTPDMVIISHTGGGTLVPELYLTGMSANSKDFNGTNKTTAIKSVNATNIVIGSDVAVNQNTSTYAFIAIKAQ